MIKLLIYSNYHNDYLYVNQQVKDIETGLIGYIQQINYKNENNFMLIVSFKGNRKGYIINTLNKLSMI